MQEDRLYFKAAFALIVKDGLILTSLRYDKPVRGLIGGLIDLGETKWQAMIREVKEECGLTVLKYEEFFSELPSENSKLPVVTFFVSEFEGEISDPEGLGIAWVPASKLDAYPEYNLPMLEEFKTKFPHIELKESNMKTVTRQAFEAAKQSLKILEEKRSELSEQEYEADKLIAKFIPSLIKEEKILSKLNWELRLSSSNTLWLYLIGGDEDLIFDVIERSSWHCDIDLDAKTKLFFNDLTISINIEDSEHLKSLMQEFGIKFSIENKFKEKMVALEQLVKANQSILDMAK